MRKRYKNKHQKDTGQPHYINKEKWQKKWRENGHENEHGNGHENGHEHPQKKSFRQKLKDAAKNLILQFQNFNTFLNRFVRDQNLVFFNHFPGWYSILQNDFVIDFRQSVMFIIIMLRIIITEEMPFVDIFINDSFLHELLIYCSILLLLFILLHLSYQIRSWHYMKLQDKRFRFILFIVIVLSSGWFLFVGLHIMIEINTVSELEGYVPPFQSYFDEYEIRFGIKERPENLKWLALYEKTNYIYEFLRSEQEKTLKTRELLIKIYHYSKK